MSERLEYDEFGYFHENAEEYGIPYGGPPTVRRETVGLTDGRRLSALVWGDGDPEMVLIHGGAQNAHTWDTVALALDRPLVAVDMPSHGHSDDQRTEPADAVVATRIAMDLAEAIPKLTSGPTTIVGMSLGGLTSIALFGRAPELFRNLVLVDVTPGVTGEKAKAIIDFVHGPATFPSFDELLARTIQYNPTRTESSLRRGILHNAEQLEDGSWVWRHHRGDRPVGHESASDSTEGADAPTAPDMSAQWEDVGRITVPLMLVRGMRSESVVDDDDEAELRRRLPGARIDHVADAGHSVQGDSPLELARLLAEFAVA